MKRLLVFSGVFIFIFSLFTMVETIAQTRKSVSGTEVTGTFRDVSGSEFSILALGKGKLRVSFSGIYIYKIVNGEPMAHTGEARGEAEIAGDTATFKPGNTQECTITMKFLLNRRMKVMQKGSDAECGFGHNVSAAGNYKKISNAKPKFSAQ
jgi:hypothetical protein